MSTCSNCAEPHAPSAVFCESCGFDFLTGSMPDPEPARTSLGGAAAREGAAAGPATVAVISCDRAFHERMDTDGVLTYPDPEPAPVRVPLAGATVLVGRARPDRGHHPDIDLSTDPAASSRHAVLRRRADGGWTVTDIGSTNGTYLGDATEPLVTGVEVDVAPGTPIFVGGWTRIELALEVDQPAT